MSNIITFQLHSKFQVFLHQTSFVFSQIKYIKHIKRIFILLPGSYPEVGLGVKNLISLIHLFALFHNLFDKFNTASAPRQYFIFILMIHRG